MGARGGARAGVGARARAAVAHGTFFFVVGLLLPVMHYYSKLLVTRRGEMWPFACGSGPGRPRFPGRSLLKEGDVRPLSQLAPMGVGPRQRTRPLGTAEIRPVLLCGTPNTSVDTREVPPSCLKEAPAPM